MTITEKLLYNYQRAKRDEQEIRRQIAELQTERENLYGLKAVPLDKLRGGNVDAAGRLFDAVYTAVEKAVDVYAARINQLSDELMSAHTFTAAIEHGITIANLTATEHEYIRLRYFAGMSAWKTAQKIGYSESQALRVKKSALKKMEDNGGLAMV